LRVRWSASAEEVSRPCGHFSVMPAATSPQSSASMAGLVRLRQLGPDARQRRESQPSVSCTDCAIGPGMAQASGCAPGAVRLAGKHSPALQSQGLGGPAALSHFGAHQASSRFFIWASRGCSRRARLVSSKGSEARLNSSCRASGSFHAAGKMSFQSGASCQGHQRRAGVSPAPAERSEALVFRTPRLSARQGRRDARPTLLPRARP